MIAGRRLDPLVKPKLSTGLRTCRGAGPHRFRARDRRGCEAHSGTGVCSGSRGCRPTTSTNSSISPTAMSSSTGRPTRSAARCAVARSSIASSASSRARPAPVPLSRTAGDCASRGASNDGYSDAQNLLWHILQFIKRRAIGKSSTVFGIAIIGLRFPTRQAGSIAWPAFRPFGPGPATERQCWEWQAQGSGSTSIIPTKRRKSAALNVSRRRMLCLSIVATMLAS
jgi:hypothetical protein